MLGAVQSALLGVGAGGDAGGWFLNSLVPASITLRSTFIGTQETAPTAVVFKPDGTKMYVLGTTSDRVYEYDLGTAWLVSSAVYNSVSFLVQGQDNSPSGLFFKPDGTKMYIVGTTNDTVYEYDLSTPWLVSSAVYNSVSFLIQGQETNPTGLFFKPDGTKMYVVGTGNDRVYEYDLSTPWLVSSAVYNSVSFFVQGQETAPSCLFFKPDGTKMYIVGSTTDTVYEYDLSTPWLVSSAAYNSINFFVGVQEDNPQALFFKPDGTKMYIVGQTNNRVYEYDTSFEV